MVVVIGRALNVRSGWKTDIALYVEVPEQVEPMTDAQAELIACLDEMAELARRRAIEWPDGIRHEQYEKIAAMAAKEREQLLSNDFRYMGAGAGLGYGKGLGEWGFPENGDEEMARLGYRADELYRTGGAG